MVQQFDKFLPKQPAGRLSLSKTIFRHINVGVEWRGVRFTKDGVFSTTIMVRDKQTHQLVATIVPRIFGKSAAIYLPSGESWEWYATSMFAKDKWKLSSLSGIDIRGTVTLSGSGGCESNTRSTLPILLAAYLANSYSSRKIGAFLLIISILMLCVVVRRF